MKTFFKISSLLLLAFVVTVSCSDDDDPADNNLFVGTYNGTIGYTEDGSDTDITTEDGRVTVVKVDDNYRFDFSNSIPSLTGLEMEEDQNVLVLIGDDGTGTVRIDAEKLDIAYTRDGETWTADCTR
ncbi:MAG TPA: hypothetical protein VFM69_07865 [Pricia sp.]|nr:hypothetical protein [Pricia sp.]